MTAEVQTRSRLRVAIIVLLLVVSTLGVSEPAAGSSVRFVTSGSRVWDTTEISSGVIGSSGPLFRFNVKTEIDLGYDADQFAEEALAILSDQRSWTGTGDARFQLVAGGSNAGLAADTGVEFTLYLATPGTVDALCAPLQTIGELSCRNGNRVVENFERWTRGPDVYHDSFAGELDVYREYLINHEVGHRIGKSHQNITTCRADLYAPVMMQQTFDVRGCVINGWPAYDLLTVGSEPAPAPSGPCDLSEVYPWDAERRPLDDSVIRLYQAAFGRAPDPDGLDYWIARRANGVGLDALADEFLASPEGQDRFGGSDDPSFVGALYRNVLDRAGDPEGERFWIDHLGAGASRASVLVQFSESPENVELTGTSRPQSAEQGWIGRLYKAVFDRSPDCEGARFWLWAPLSDREIVDVFVASPEFVARYGDANDNEFITLLYANVLDREADDAGLQFWTDQLAVEGFARVDVVLAWISSPEFIALTGTS